jgi:hypothetical protein
LNPLYFSLAMLRMTKPDPELLPATQPSALPRSSVSDAGNRRDGPKKRHPRPKLDLETEAVTALEEARALPPGPDRTEAMKRAGILRNAADLQGVFFARRGRPPKD